MKRIDGKSVRFDGAEEKSFRRGYQLPAQAKPSLKQFMQTNLAASVVAALWDLSMILLLGISGSLAMKTWLLPYALLAHLPIFVFIARYQRALESLVHEASHYNWCRSRRWLNDLAADLLAAIPTLSTVRRYRAFHLPHHDALGDRTRDTDLQRYLALGVEEIDRRNPARFLSSMLRVLPAYSLSWWRYIGTNPQVVLAGIAWHAFVVVVPLAALFGLGHALILWSVYWFVPFAFVLPVVRFIGETGEHVYSGSDSIYTATISNIGRVHQWFTNPHHDGYHVLHHLYASIPHHQLPQAHRWLMEHDPDGYARTHRHRLRIFEDPRP
jgi:fatty acid desaturase